MDTPNIDTLGGRVAYLLKLAGLDRKAAGKLAGLAGTGLGQVILGRAYPTTPTLIQLMRITGASADWLLLRRGRGPSREKVLAHVADAKRVPMARRADAWRRLVETAA